MRNLGFNPTQVSKLGEILLEHASEADENFNVMLINHGTATHGNNRTEIVIIDSESFFLCISTNDFTIIIPDSALNMSTLISLWDRDYIYINDISMRVVLNYFNT
jgi:hypothetical protein